jgi:hypothetical protein
MVGRTMSWYELDGKVLVTTGENNKHWIFDAVTE